MRGPLDRPVQLFVSKNGIVFIVQRGTKPPKGLLPFHSTQTKAEAEGLVVRFCRLSRQDNETYILNEFGGELEDLYKATDLFEAEYQRRHAKRGASHA